MLRRQWEREERGELLKKARQLVGGWESEGDSRAQTLRLKATY